MGKPSKQHTTRLLEAAITIAGSEAKLGNLAGYSQNSIWYAKRNGRVSAELAAAIDRATNGAIPKEQLRPDLFNVNMTRTANENTSVTAAARWLATSSPSERSGPVIPELRRRFGLTSLEATIACREANLIRARAT